MGCPSCGAENPPTNRFCGDCGAALTASCASCGFRNPPANRFCGECGARLGAEDTPSPASRTAPVGPAPSPRTYTPRHLAEQILGSRTALEGERKQVTVLFADVVGSTELIQGIDPEEAQALLDGAVRVMMDAVHRYEGTVCRLLGDGLMALFGAPLAHEDHAVRACYAALALQDGMRRYAEDVFARHALRVEARVGLNSGEVIVRLVSDDLHMDYTAMGQTVHLAARMEQLAAAGSSVLTAETLGLVEGYVRVRSLGRAPVKGLAEPVDVFELVGAGAVRTRLEASAARGLTRFVGRQAELEAIHKALEQAGGGHGQIVALVGEPGVGKSRLVWELTHSHRTHGWTILESGSVSYGKATAYLPVVDLLKAYCRIEARDDARAVREKLTGKLLTLDRALEPSLPALLSLLDVSVEDPAWEALDPPRRRRQTLDAIRHLLLGESRVRPLLLVFEDLHWIDSETQAALDLLVESLPTAGLLLLVNYRPEYRHEWGSKTYYTQLRVDPLPAENAGELLDALLGHDGSVAGVKPLLVARTDRNPFFLEESVRGLVETGALVGDRGAYRLARDLPDVRVPATVQAVLAARIDRLPPEEKRLLQTAAVVGQDVPLAILRAVADRSDEELRAGLARLQAAEFLYEAGLFPELEYTFKHALTHEVAYGGLLQERRRALHGQIVVAIERLWADRLGEQAERLARHALAAEAWEKALAYGRQAGRKAAARSAYRDAAAYFEQALLALERLPKDREALEQAIDLRLELRGVLFTLAEHARIRDHLGEAETVAERLGDRRRLGRVLAYRVFYLHHAGDHLGALAMGRRIPAAGDDDPVLRLHPLFFTARAHAALGDYRQALVVIGEIVAYLRDDLLHERFGMPANPAANARGLMAACLAELGDFAAAGARAEEAVRIAEAIDHPHTLAIALLELGGVCLRRGDLPRATATLERALQLCRTWDLLALTPMVVAWLGSARTLAGSVDDGLRLLAEAEQHAERGLYGEGSLRGIWLAEAHLAAGAVDAATRYAHQALELAVERAERGRQAYALRVLGNVATVREPSDAAALATAEDHYRQALALAEALEMRPLQAHCQADLGRVHLEMRQVEAARSELAAAVALYRSMGMTHWLPRAEAELAQATTSLTARS